MQESSLQVLDMELSSTVTLFIGIGTQILTSVGLFWAVTSYFNARINGVENSLNIRINGIENRLTSVEKDIEYIKKDLDRILSYFPAPKLVIHKGEE
jgi:hypothetical protein